MQLHPNMIKNKPLLTTYELETHRLGMSDDNASVRQLISFSLRLQNRNRISQCVVAADEPDPFTETPQELQFLCCTPALQNRNNRPEVSPNRSALTELANSLVDSDT